MGWELGGGVQCSCGHSEDWSANSLIVVELQWFEHRWLVYHGYFELVLKSLIKINP